MILEKLLIFKKVKFQVSMRQKMMFPLYRNIIFWHGERDMKNRQSKKDWRLRLLIF